MLRKAFDDAVGLLFLRSNPALGAKPPKSARSAGAAIRYWTTSELRRFLDENRDHHHWPLWYLAANTGMRRGELLGLRWRDVDLAAARLSIRSSRSDIRSQRRTRRPHAVRAPSISIHGPSESCEITG